MHRIRESQYSRSVDVFKIWKWDLHHILAYHSYFKVASTNISMGVPRINFFCEQNNLPDWPGFRFGLVCPVLNFTAQAVVGQGQKALGSERSGERQVQHLSMLPTLRMRHWPETPNLSGFWARRAKHDHNRATLPWCVLCWARIHCMID